MNSIHLLHINTIALFWLRKNGGVVFIMFKFYVMLRMNASKMVGFCKYAGRFCWAADIALRVLYTLSFVMDLWQLDIANFLCKSDN